MSGPSRLLRELAQSAERVSRLERELARAKDTRNRRIARAAQQGLSYAAIARQTGLAPQRVWQIVQAAPALPTPTTTTTADEVTGLGDMQSGQHESST